MKKLTLLALILFSWSVIFGQKLGYIDLESILQAMPEVEKAKAQLEKEYREMQNLLEELQVEYNKKLQEFQQNMQLPEDDPNKWSKSMQQMKMQELQELQQKIVNYQTQAQQTLMQRQDELFKPIYAKVDSAVDVIAKQKGYSVVFIKDNVFYINPDKVDNLTNEVLKTLGIKQD